MSWLVRLLDRAIGVRPCAVCGRECLPVRDSDRVETLIDRDGLTWHPWHGERQAHT